MTLPLEAAGHRDKSKNISDDRYGYLRLAECETIEKVHNKLYCYVPPEVWGISAQTVCQVCQLKNQRLFVEIALEANTQASFQNLITDPPPVIKFPAQLPLKPVGKERMCSECGVTQLWIVKWESGERICGTCRQGAEKRSPAVERACRFCGQQNVYPNQWRAQERMCSKKDCWIAFLHELESKRVQASVVVNAS